MASIKSCLISLKLVTSLLIMPTYFRPLFRHPLIPTDSLYYAGRVRGCRQSPDCAERLWIAQKPWNHLNCLMLADDVVLLSETVSGLQNCINRMSNYCSIWQSIYQKPKVFFNKGGHRTSRFTFSLHDKTIEITQSCTSLGIVFASSGSFRQACNVFTDKAKRKLLSCVCLTPKSWPQNSFKCW